MLVKFIPLLFLSLAFVGCSQDDSAVDQNENAPEIHFTASTYNISTKAIHTGNTLPKGAAVGIFGWGRKKGESSPSVVRADLINAKYTTDNGVDLTSLNQAHFPIETDTVIDFYAYYPHQADLTEPAISYQLQDQYDILWATPVLGIGKDDVGKDANGNTTSVPMVFNHILSAITLVIKKDDQITEKLVLQKIELLAYPHSTTLDVTTGQLTPAKETSTYVFLDKLSEELTTTDDTLVEDHLLWPGAAPTFRFTINDHVYSVTPTTAFQANSRQTYTFTIKAKDISVSASINPWVTGPGGSGEIGI